MIITFDITKCNNQICSDSCVPFRQLDYQKEL